MSGRDLRYYNAKFNEIPIDTLEKATHILNEVISDAEIEEIQEQIDSEGLMKWIGELHFGWGMAIRNELRSRGLIDELLPDENWDDYYIQCIEYLADRRRLI